MDGVIASWHGHKIMLKVFEQCIMFERNVAKDVAAFLFGIGSKHLV